MIYGLYLSAAGLQAQEARQNVIANNLANANNNGFKRDLLLMQSRQNASYEDPKMFPYRIPVLKDQGGGVIPASGGIDLSQASILSNSNPTDVALDGPGFFTVQGDPTPGNNARDKLLTRDGSFLLNHEGTLVTAKGGRAVLSADGEPIKLNPDLPISIGANGLITQGDGVAVQLGLVDVANPRHLLKLGGNLLTVNAGGKLTDISPGTMVRQSALEASGVDPIIETVNLMQNQRAFDANARMISFQDTTLSQLNTIGRIA